MAAALRARPGAHGPAKAAGFTLIELMVAILCAAILLAVAIPSFESTINGGRLATAANELLTSLQAARIEAVRYNHRTTVCLSRNAQAAAPTCAPAASLDANGWITFVDANNNGTYELATDRLLRQATVHPAIRLRASSNIPAGVRVTYRADGFARNAAGTALLSGAIAVCLPTRRPIENVRRVLIGTGSRVVVERLDATGACNAPANT
jgi:type IV fimbrial biogenesis protein FimT